MYRIPQNTLHYHYTYLLLCYIVRTGQRLSTGISSCGVTSHNTTISIHCSYSTVSANHVNGFTVVIQDTSNMEELMVGQVVGASEMRFQELEAGRYVVTVLPDLTSLSPLHSTTSSSSSAPALDSSVIHSQMMAVHMEVQTAGTAMQPISDSSYSPFTLVKVSITSFLQVNVINNIIGIL